MIRFTALAAVLAAMVLSMSACTNTVRGIGTDLNNTSMQNYNSRMATDVDH